MRRPTTLALAMTLALPACSSVASVSPSSAPSSTVSPSSTAASRDDPLPPGLIAYVAGADPQIHLLDPATGESQQLTQLQPGDAQLGAQPPTRLVISCAFGILYLEWSPDGQTIAFDYGGCEANIFVAELSGEHVKVGEGHRPRWSPDGKSLAFGANTTWDPRGGAGGILVADIAGGGGVVPLSATGEGFGSYDPYWSPDGSLITFTGSDPDNPEQSAVYAVDDAGTQSVLARGAFAAGWLDDSRLLITTNESSITHLLDLDDDSAVELGVGIRSLAAPGGGRVALWRFDMASGEETTAIVTPDGDALAELPGMPMAWAPDGQTLLVGVADADGSVLLRLVDGDGRELAEYVPAPQTNRETADWQPAAER